jgi:protoporphyrinogen oxidase
MPAKSIVDRKVVIIGAGPAGLTAAYELSKHSVPAVVLERDNTVGGLARTVNHKGYLFDVGGHRFFTKWDEVNQIWREVLGEQFLERSRLSRIFYRRKFFYYPLRVKNALFGLGVVDSARVVVSYLKSQLFHYENEQNLEQWFSNRFGKRLYEIFFKAYTEKVWGVPCTEIRAEWAAQRVQSLSLTTAISNALYQPKKTRVKTLISSFHYPRRGPGQMWESMTELLRKRGYQILLERPVTRILHDGSGLTAFEAIGPAGLETYEGTDFISSMPIRELVQALDPPAPKPVQEAAARLRYRDFLIVSLVVNRKEVMPDNWIYIHEPSVLVGRIQNFKNWSPDMVPDPDKTCLGMEYFVFENDDVWASPDDKLIDLAKREIAELGLVKPEEIEDGTVVRMPKAYPMYDSGWAKQVATIREYLELRLPNLQLVGRNGMHKYNNQDHSMMTALCAARNIMGAKYNLWAINSEPDYYEEQHEHKKPSLLEMEPGRPAMQSRFAFRGVALALDSDASKTSNPADI